MTKIIEGSSPMLFELSEGNSVHYLVEHRVISPEDGRCARAESLGGGVSNVVVKVSFGAGDSDALVLKQSLPKLRVAEDWFAARERIYRERAGIDYLAGVLPASSIPRVVDEDPDNFIFTMTAAPGDGVNWKEALLNGEINPAVSTRVGNMLAEIHQSSLVVDDDVPTGLRQFADLDCFVQLRVDPYHRATAAAHPDLADVIENEAQRMLPSAGERRALVHGDFSPKNIIVTGQGAEACAFLLDFEVVHLGNPVFDLAFMLNHFTLKAIYNPALAERYCEAARSFWRAYLDAAGAAMGHAHSLERDAVRQLGALLLARIDGKSPAEYITDDARKGYARRLARSILTGAVAALSEIHDRLSQPDNPAFG